MQIIPDNAIYIKCGFRCFERRFEIWWCKLKLALLLLSGVGIGIRINLEKQNFFAKSAQLSPGLRRRVCIHADLFFGQRQYIT